MVSSTQVLQPNIFKYIHDIHLPLISHIWLINSCPFKPYIFLKYVHFYHGQHPSLGHQHFSPRLLPYLLQSSLPFQTIFHSSDQVMLCLLSSNSRMSHIRPSIIWLFLTLLASSLEDSFPLYTLRLCPRHNEQAPIWLPLPHTCSSLFLEHRPTTPLGWVLVIHQVPSHVSYPLRISSLPQ